MKRSFSPLLAVALVGLSFFILFIIVLSHDASAASTTYDLNPALPDESTVSCVSLGGSWSNNTNTCTLRKWATIRSGYSVRVEAGATLSIIRPTQSEVRLTIDPKGRIANYGTISNNGNFENHGIIDNYRGGRIDTGPSFSTHSGGTFNNHNGAILNISSFVNFDYLYNNGTIISNLGGRISNAESGRIKNSGNITNKGEIGNGGTISNYGTIRNYDSNSTIYNRKNILSDYSGVIINYGEGLIVNSGGLIFNEGRIETRGTLDNKGIIENYGSILNDGSVINNSTSIIFNHNSGTIDNKGGIDNYGNITAIYGVFGNGGTTKNKCGGVISGTISGNPVTNTCTSTTTTATTTITTITSTESIQRIAEPNIYIWAVGATAVAVALTATLLLRTRSQS